MNTIDFFDCCAIIVNVLIIQKEKEMDKENKELYKSTIQKMVCVGRLHRAVFEKHISDLGLHHSQHCLLIYIAKHGEIESQKQIAEKFGITPAAVARTLKGLESDGYIERTTIEKDGRSNKIIITEKGKNIVNTSFVAFHDIDSNTFEDFSEEDMLIFNTYLDRMHKRLHGKYNEGCVKKTDEKE